MGHIHISDEMCGHHELWDGGGGGGGGGQSWNKMGSSSGGGGVEGGRKEGERETERRLRTFDILPRTILSLCPAREGDAAAALCFSSAVIKSSCESKAPFLF